MQALFPPSSSPAPSSRPEHPVDLADWYGHDWVDRGGIRANMISSIDGAGAADGLSAGLQTSGDNAVFATLRELADVVLVGWSTARAEHYGAISLDADQVARRAGRGFGPRLPVALITRSLSVDLDAPLLAADDTVIVTCESSDPDRRRALGERAEVLVYGRDDIDYGALRRGFAERGWTRVLCEGGPTILGQVIRAGELDELCLTLAPLAAGPGETGIVAGDPWPDGPRQLALRGVLEEDGALFARYGLSGTARPTQR